MWRATPTSSAKIAAQNPPGRVMPPLPRSHSGCWADGAARPDPQARSTRLAPGPRHARRSGERRMVASNLLGLTLSRQPAGDRLHRNADPDPPRGPPMRALLLAIQLLAVGALPAEARQGGEFAALVARLSGPGGYFDSDNLVSNETSYLHVIPALKALEVRGGAYVGVGPEQNFSYLAEIRPDLAILIDIRRDNMLLHLLFKAMFETARNRVEYLCLLYGRPAPKDPGRWTGAPLEDILTYLDITPPSWSGWRATGCRWRIRTGPRSDGFTRSSSAPGSTSASPASTGRRAPATPRSASSTRQPTSTANRRATSRARTGSAPYGSSSSATG